MFVIKQKIVLNEDRKFKLLTSCKQNSQKDIFNKDISRNSKVFLIKLNNTLEGEARKNKSPQPNLTNKKIFHYIPLSSRMNIEQ